MAHGGDYFYGLGGYGPNHPDYGLLARGVQPCPSCGKCPTCGRGNAPYYGGAPFPGQPGPYRFPTSPLIPDPWTVPLTTDGSGNGTATKPNTAN